MRDKRVLISALVVFFLGITLLYLFNKSISYEKQEVISKQMDSLLLTLENRLEQVSKVALTSSIILSKNQHIIESLKYQEREPCLEHLMLIKNSLTFEKVINNIEFHLHTDEFKSLLRLWDYKSKSKDDLSGFRHSLNKVKQTKESVYGVEVGRFGMFMRAISPVTERSEERRVGKEC